MPSRRVLIVGAGFGGFTLARALEGAPVEVLLLDRNNYHLFTPLLYQVASALLNPSDIVFPIRKGFRRARNVRFRLESVTGVDLDAGEVATASGERFAYDRLVLATGSATNFFGLDSVAEVAEGLKDLEEAIALRNRVLSAFESAVRTRDPAERRRCLTFVVAGGGPTGVEFAGALSELIRLNLRNDFPEIDLAEVRVLLVEATDRVLSMFRDPLSDYARRELEKRRIRLLTGRRLTGAGPGHVELDGGERIPSRTLVWAAGVKPAEFASALAAPRSRTGRVRVDRFLRLEGREREYAIGDLASFVQDGEELPMLAPPAMQQARHLAANLLRDLRGAPLVPFRYRDKGVMATIGRKAAVAQTEKLSLTGLPGWLGWLVLHLWYIMGARNRVAVLLYWAWEYFRYDRPIRIITETKKPR